MFNLQSILYFVYSTNTLILYLYKHWILDFEYIIIIIMKLFMDFKCLIGTIEWMSVVLYCFSSL